MFFESHTLKSSVVTISSSPVLSVTQIFNAELACNNNPLNTMAPLLIKLRPTVATAESHAGRETGEVFIQRHFELQGSRATSELTF